MQEWRLAMMRARVAGDAYLAIGFVECPVQQTFFAFGQHATAGRGGGRVFCQDDIQHGMQVLDLLG